MTEPAIRTDRTGKRFGLSNSKIAMFEQCPKRLWLSVHRPELAQQSKNAEARFAIGHEVGAAACALVADGIMVEALSDARAALARTRALLAGEHRRPIFEATLEHDGVLVRIDVLEPDGDGWRMAEVKSSTGAKDYHLGDLATQLWVARNAGVVMTSALIRHLDNQFVLAREGEFDGLFRDTDLTALAEPIVDARTDTVAAARAVLSDTEPATAPGDHCEKPFSCEFAGHCHAALPSPPEWPVSVLPYGGGRRWVDRGVEDLFDIDPAALSNPLHRRVWHATTTGTPYHDVAGAHAAIEAWAYPRTWLDFETIGFAVPRWVGTRPYQQVPFQFSAHVETADGQLEHREFLHLDGSDPRRACSLALIAAVPPTGAVIAYNAGFERGRIIELAEAFPDLAECLTQIADRLVDLLPVTRANWYHRDQRGSWSIKAVLPTVAPELDYSDLEVSDGMLAQLAYLEATSKDTSVDRRAEIDAALRLYCGLDTEAMIWLARRLVLETSGGSGADT